MTPGARIQAVIEILEDWERGAGPADRLVETYGRTHRFAGSKDRAAIGERVFTIFRRRGDLAEFMNTDDPRALAFASLRVIDGLDLSAITQLCTGPYAPPPPDAGEAKALDRPVPPPGNNLPAWIAAKLDAKAAALTERAPLDLRINRLKAKPEEIRAVLADAKPCPFVPLGLRLETHRRLENTPLVQDGLIEIQDEGSQIAAHLVGAEPGMRILDLCAGAGGKSLAMASDMDNRGEITVFDSDRRRLARLWPRAERAEVKILRDHPPEGTYDRVLIDAPCSGSGTWRRAPDAAWRLTEAELSRVIEVQTGLLNQAADSVASGGRLIYVTCSLFAAENHDQVQRFLNRRPDFTPLDWTGPAKRSLNPDLPKSAENSPFLSLTPALHGTDGFFVAILERRPQIGV